jgi:hypothetical protein
MQPLLLLYLLQDMILEAEPASTRLVSIYSLIHLAKFQTCLLLHYEGVVPNQKRYTLNFM